MTNHQELSEKLAGMLGIDASTQKHSDVVINGVEFSGLVWLTQDSARMFELMAERDVVLEYMVRFVRAISDFTSMAEAAEFYVNHTDKAESTRIAIAKAIIAKEEK